MSAESDEAAPKKETGGHRSAGVSGLLALIEEPLLGARQELVEADKEIFSEDEGAEHIFLIHSGQVRTYQRRSDRGSERDFSSDGERGGAGLVRLVDVLGPGEWFGVAALAGVMNYGVRAVAVTRSVIWKVGIEPLLSTLRANPEVLAGLNRDLARGVVEARAEAARLIFEDCNQRLISALVRLSSSAASTPQDDGVVLRMTHSELAQAVGAARETVSLGLTHLRNRNLLRTGRNQLFFNPDDLRRLGLE